MPKMSDRIAALEAERSEIIDHNWSLQETVDVLSRERDELQATVNEEMRILREANTWQDRATAAEQELAALRKEIGEYVGTLRDTLKGGPVAYRLDIAGRLAQILDA